MTTPHALLLAITVVVVAASYALGRLHELSRAIQREEANDELSKRRLTRAFDLN